MTYMRLKTPPKPVLVAKNGILYLKTRLCDGPRLIEVTKCSYSPVTLQRTS